MNLLKLLFSIIFLKSIVLLGQQNTIPDNVVDVSAIIPDLDIDLRYHSTNNFVGDTIIGYKSNILYLTEPAAKQLKLVQSELQEQNLCLLVFDGYRPQRAVNHFTSWARDLNDTINKAKFYPNVKKQNLLKAGYIASRSGHSRGSTVDLTIIDGNTGEPLDMGTSFDFFGPESWLNYPELSKQQRANRKLLSHIMRKHNFRGYSKEWWHFTLKEEPYTKTYFDFEIVN